MYHNGLFYTAGETIFARQSAVWSFSSGGVLYNRQNDYTAVRPQRFHL